MAAQLEALVFTHRREMAARGKSRAEHSRARGRCLGAAVGIAWPCSSYCPASLGRILHKVGSKVDQTPNSQQHSLVTVGHLAPAAQDRGKPSATGRMLTLVDNGAGDDPPSTIQLSHTGCNTFGRAMNPSGALPKDHHTILGQYPSRLHAYITCQQLPDGARRWLIKDNKSTNGLFLDRQRLDQDETVLKDGDQITFGGKPCCPLTQCLPESWFQVPIHVPLVRSTNLKRSNSSISSVMVPTPGSARSSSGASVRLEH